MAPQQPPAKNSESTCLERRWTSGSINDSCGRLLPRGQGSSSAGRGVLPGYPDQLRRRSLTEDTHSSTCPRESQLRSLHSQINQNKNVRLFFFFFKYRIFFKKCAQQRKKVPQTPDRKGFEFSEFPALEGGPFPAAPPPPQGQPWFRLMKLGH